MNHHIQKNHVRDKSTYCDIFKRFSPPQVALKIALVFFIFLLVVEIFRPLGLIDAGRCYFKIGRPLMIEVTRP